MDRGGTLTVVYTQHTALDSAALRLGLHSGLCGTCAELPYA
jgi:hypothetical protein